MFEFRNLIRMLARIAGAGMAAAGLAFALPVSAQGDLLVAPTRLILDSRGAGQIILSNIGNEEATYRITAELRRMRPDGSLEVVTTDQANEIERAALEMVRFAPRRVVLPPGQPQSIRISARPPAELPDGEYRVHLSFNALPKVAPVAEQPAGAEADRLSIRLVPIYGISIPVIVRKGALDARASISNPRIEPGEDGREIFRLDMAREGEASVYGEIVAIRPGQEDPVFLVRGIAVYPEITQRALNFPLTPEQAAALRAGNLRIEYREFVENGGAVLASFEGAIG